MKQFKKMFVFALVCVAFPLAAQSGDGWDNAAIDGTGDYPSNGWAYGFGAEYMGTSSNWAPDGKMETGGIGFLLHMSWLNADSIGFFLKTHQGIIRSVKTGTSSSTTDMSSSYPDSMGVDIALGPNWTFKLAEANYLELGVGPMVNMASAMKTTYSVGSPKPILVVAAGIHGEAAYYLSFKNGFGLFVTGAAEYGFAPLYSSADAKDLTSLSIGAGLSIMPSWF